MSPLPVTSFVGIAHERARREHLVDQAGEVLGLLDERGQHRGGRGIPGAHALQALSGHEDLRDRRAQLVVDAAQDAVLELRCGGELPVGEPQFGRACRDGGFQAL